MSFRPKISSDERGFVFASAAIVVAVILGIAIVYLTRSQSINIIQAADTYSGSQSYWAALSGIEYAIENSVDLEDTPGTYNYFNGSVTLSTSDSYQNGTLLPDGYIRLISKGSHGETYRRLEVLFEVVYNQDFWPALSLIQEVERQNKPFVIHNQFSMNGSLYIGGNVKVHCKEEGDDNDGDCKNKDNGNGGHGGGHGNGGNGNDDNNCASIGEPPGLPTTIYVPAGKTVTGNFNDSFGWSTTAVQTLPELDRNPYTSRIATAYSISETVGNKCQGNYTLTGGILDLNQYEDKTFYVNGKLTLKGVSVIGGTIIEPGIIVTTGKTDFMNFGTSPTVFGDNIIVISDSDIYFKNKTQFGANYSALPPGDWPAKVNLVYSNDMIKIYKDADVWAQIISPSEVRLMGSAHGVIWCGDKFKINSPGAFFEGALYVKQVDDPHDKFVNGYMNLHHSVPIYYFEGLSYRVVEGTLNEY